jgi:hypothetical protein
MVQNGRKEANLFIRFLIVLKLLWSRFRGLSAAITPETESIRMLKQAKIDTAFRNVFLRIATSFLRLHTPF